MLPEVLQPADVLLPELLGPRRRILRVGLALDGLRHKLVQRLFKTLEPIQPIIILKEEK